MKKLLAALILTAGMGLAQFSVGIHIGQPPRPRVIRVRPNAPGPGYSWVDGYWYPAGEPLYLASRLLDSPTVRGFAMECAAL